MLMKEWIAEYKFYLVSNFSRLEAVQLKMKLIFGVISSLMLVNFSVNSDAVDVAQKWVEVS